MARERLAVRKIREILRLRWDCQKSRNSIAVSVCCGRDTVSEYLERAAAAGITQYEQVAALDDVELEQKLGFTRSYLAIEKRDPSRALPDFKHIHAELKRPGVTLLLLWTEYQAVNPDGYKYTQFCEYYARWKTKLNLVMRQTHRAGEKVFVDYCDGIAITDPRTGELIATQLFVGVLGASSYTFAEASLSQDLPSWLSSHVKMYEFFHGVPAVTTPDNLRSGVQSPCRYDPEINPSYQDMAEHYGTCVLPARVRKPRDKAKAEAGVLVAQRWILAVLRNRTFYSLSELNHAIAELLEKLNTRIMRHVGKSRQDLFESIDRPALKPLPPTRYEYAEWKKVKVNIDYHIEFDHHFYSVPYSLVHERLQARGNAQTVEIFFKGRRIASHLRSHLKGEHTTLKEHMPPAHRASAEWTPSRMIQWGNSIAPSVGRVIEEILKKQPQVEWGFRPALGVIRLGDQYGTDRLVKAAEKALAMNSPHYRTLKTMLKTGMESVPLERTGRKQPPDQNQLSLLQNENVRGKGYYH